MAGLAVGAWPGGAQRGRLDLSTDALVRRASDYVAGYQRDFAFLVADESVEQHVDPASGGATRRVTRGEIFLAYLAADRIWVAVRDVADVDGQRIADRENVPALLRQGQAATIAGRVFEHNARFNLGSVRRNFNEPTIALSVLARPRVSQFRFTRGAIDTSEPDATLVTIGYRERDEPTLVRGARGQPVFANGEVVLEAETGRVRRATLAVQDGNVSAELSTVYERQDSLGLWVPAVFTEHYVAKKRPRDEVVTSESRYTNYRRFDVDARMR